MHYTSFIDRKETKKMEIIPVVPRGYCKGVVQAINLAKETVVNYPNQRITMLGMIVHNQYVIDACEHLGINCVSDKGKTRLELLDLIEDGVVIFTAHGVSDAVYEKAREKGLILVDASCSDVMRTKNLVGDYLQKDFDVIYIGKKNHPESEAILSLSNRVHLITSLEEIEILPPFKKVMLTNQTTMSILEISSLINSCNQKYPHIVILEEICQATRIRQEAVQKLTNIDCLIIVGDPHSNNTNKLKELGEQANIPKIHLIETANHLVPSWFNDVHRVAVTSGASTPTLLTNQVLASLESFSKHGEFPTLSIDFKKLLD